MRPHARKFTTTSRFFIFSLLCAICFMSMNAQAKEVESRFHVYSGGMHMLNTTLKTRLNGQQYEAEVTAQPNGFWGRLLPWRANIKSVGVRENALYRPVQVEDLSGWRDRIRETTMIYNQNGRLIDMTRRNDGGEPHKREINAKISQTGTTDLLTAIMSVLHPIANTMCSHDPKVFDGQRLFRIQTNYEGTEELAPNRYSAFSGTAHRCSIDIEPIDGFKEKRTWMVVQDKNRAENRLPTFWMVEKERGHYQIVRIELHTNYGAVIAHLQE